MEKEMTGSEILSIKLPPNDAGASTVKEYLVKLLETLWDEGDGFSGKRPFGNSGWEYDLMLALGEAGISDENDQTLGIFQAIKAL